MKNFSYKKKIKINKKQILIKYFKIIQFFIIILLLIKLNEIKFQQLKKQDYLLYFGDSNKYFLFNIFRDKKMNSLYFICSDINIIIVFNLK